MRYYAGTGYASTWSASTATTQGYDARASASRPTVVVADSWSPGAGWGASASGAAASASSSASASPVGVTSTSSSGAVAVRSLGGLLGAGVPTARGTVRLDDLVPLGDGSLEGAVTLYADAHLRVRASLAHDALPASGGATDVVIEVTGLAPPPVILPLRVHLVIDASTSMERAWDDVKDAALEVVGRLRPEDELQIVVYGTGATEALAPLAIGDGARARAVIRGLRYGGRTNIESGLRMAYGAARPAGRSLVVVLSDGVPQAGLSGADELGALAGAAHADAGAVTLAIGLGSEFHTGILSALGERGGGDFLIAPRTSELSALLAAELARHGAIVASGLEVTVLPAAGVTVASGLELRAGAIVAGQTRTFVVPLTTSHAGPLAHVRVAFLDARGRPLELEASLSLAPGATAVPRGAIGAVLDAALAVALREASRLVENGDGAGAAAALRAHVDEARAVALVHGDARLEERNEVALEIATALPELVARASWSERRRAGAALAAHAFRLAQ